MKLSEKFVIGALGGIIGAVITILITSTTPLTAKDKPVDAAFGTITCKEINVTQDNGNPAVTITGDYGGSISVYRKYDRLSSPSISMNDDTIRCGEIYILRPDGKPAIDITSGGAYRKHGYIMVYGQDNDHGRVNVYGGWSDDIGDNKTMKNDAALSVSGTIFSREFNRIAARK